MLTMPIAGQLVDRIGPGKIVLVGLVLIIAGMSVFTQVASTPAIRSCSGHCSSWEWAWAAP